MASNLARLAKGTQLHSLLDVPMKVKPAAVKHTIAQAHPRLGSHHDMACAVLAFLWACRKAQHHMKLLPPCMPVR
jgi:hypothetical protein